MNQGYRSPLGKFASSMREPNPQEAFEACRKAFHENGVVCLSLEEAERRLGWAAARQLRNLGEQAFGRRK
jgi:hypothetical protein